MAKSDNSKNLRIIFFLNLITPAGISMIGRKQSCDTAENCIFQHLMILN